MKKISSCSLLLLLLMLSVMSNGCFNVQQKTILKEGGSGTMTLHYWMKSLGDVQMGDEVGGYSFIEEEARKKYPLPNIEIKDFKLTEERGDTTRHVIMEMAFKDFNKLSDAPGFANTQASYVKGNDGMNFRYVVPQDTSLTRIKHYLTDDDVLEYTFVFPFEVKSTNGIKVDNKEGNTVKWNIPLSQHIDKDFVFSAVTKDKSGICGMFGIELPVILLFGLAVFKRMKLRKTSKEKRNSM